MWYNLPYWHQCDLPPHDIASIPSNEAAASSKSTAPVFCACRLAPPGVSFYGEDFQPVICKKIFAVHVCPFAGAFLLRWFGRLLNINRNTRAHVWECIRRRAFIPLLSGSYIRWIIFGGWALCYCSGHSRFMCFHALIVMHTHAVKWWAFSGLCCCFVLQHIVSQQD